MVVLWISSKILKINQNFTIPRGRYRDKTMLLMLYTMSVPIESQGALHLLRVSFKRLNNTVMKINVAFIELLT